MRYNKKYLTIILAILSLAFAIMSYNRGMRADANGDYYIYWQTGKHFLAGQKLYTPGLADGGFTYPPFAAMFFSLFSVFPFHISAFLFSFFINYGLWIASFVLIHKILKERYPDDDFTWPIVMALLFSIAFYWHNYIWMNANMPVLCFTLLGILYYQRKRFGLSYVFFLAGTFLKITPVLFLVFTAIKRGPRQWPLIIIAALPFIIIPAIVRGLPAGLKDWQDYYEAFVAPFTKGKIDENIISLGIPALLNKMNNGNAAVGIGPLFNIPPTTLKIVIVVVQTVILGALLLKFIYDRYIKGHEGFSVADYCIIFIVTLLLPGRVWAHHHVCTGFIYTYLFFELLRQKRVWMLAITCFLCLLTNIITKDAVGQSITNVLKHYSFVTLVMLFVSAVIIWIAYVSPKQPFENH